jgi:glutamate racemase
MPKPAPIGVFDSGYGGLTVLRELVNRLPQYDYLYLGDNARSPYGTRSFQTVYQYTLEAVKWFFAQGCSLVILACNTAWAKALRTIQQRDLPMMNDPVKRVLGVIRPTTEAIGAFSQSGAVGILATSGTVASESYLIEIAKFFPELKVYQEACPMWVPLIENNEMDHHGSAFFIKKNLHSLFQKSEKIDMVLLACTHYPLMQKQIREHLPVDVKLISQGDIVAKSLEDYLHRHPEIAQYCSKNAQREFFTTDSTEDFNMHASRFFGESVQSKHLDLGEEFEKE